MRLAVILIVFFLYGCSNTSLERVKNFGGSERILIVSKFDDKILIKKFESFSWSSPDFYMEIPNWDVNNFITHKTQHLLSKKYTTLSSNEVSNKIIEPKVNFFTGYPYPIKLEHIQTYIQTNKVNYILLITPIEFNGVFGGNTNSDGLGVFQNTISNQYSKVFGLVSFDLYDATTGEYVYGNGNIGLNDPNSSWFYSKPINISTVAKPEDFPVGEIKLIKSELEGVIDKILLRSVKHLSLGV